MAFLAGLASQLLPNVISGIGSFAQNLASGKGFLESAKQGLVTGLGGLTGQSNQGINQNAANSYMTPRIISNPNQINNRQFYSMPTASSNEGLVARNNSYAPEGIYRAQQREQRDNAINEYKEYGGRPLRPTRAGAPMTNTEDNMIAAENIRRKMLKRRKKKLIKGKRRYKDYFEDDEPEYRSSKGRNRRY